MRLTLRTLLAYLDDTLDPQDSEALKAKLVESGFATQLVQRIRDVLIRKDLSAPSPSAVGPVEEANVISEYLDSTLPAEQVAEIERACLDSEPQLAEAAACHQVLTLVLGTPAEVSPELRDRIYELPDRKIEEIVTGGSFSALAIPQEGERFDALTDGLPSAEVPPVTTARPVQPVGVGDSGVFDAPTRLRQIEAGESSLGEKAVAGAKSRSIDSESRIYGGSIRPSRITPWLGLLALVALLLFSIARIFEPLLQPNSLAEADSERTAETVNAMTESSDPSNSAAIDSVNGSTDPVEDSNRTSDVSVNEIDRENALLPSKADAQAEGNSPAASDSVASVAKSNEENETTPTVIPEPGSEESVPTTDDSSGAASNPPSSVAMPPSANDLAVDSTSVQPPSAANVSQTPAGPPDGASGKAAMEGVESEPGQTVAKLVSGQTLVAAMMGDEWVRLSRDTDIASDLDFVVGPGFRAEMTMDQLEITMVGPSQARWIIDEAGQPVLSLTSGRMLVSATEPNVALATELGGEVATIGFADIESVAAVTVGHLRRPGLDPLVAANHDVSIQIMSVQGSVTLTQRGGEQTLSTSEQISMRGSDEPVLATLDTAPAWTLTADPNPKTLETTARNGLLELLESEPSLEIGLREATTFRRSEVAALAAETLVTMGRADVYFGGAGILSEPKQRAYWPEHYDMLMAMVDQSSQAAKELKLSIERMDNANALPLFRLLTGYSTKQLQNGGDAELVGNLDSSSMAVRVLALENLHRITGTTLYFRAEQENAVRRAPLIKKWETRQRKGDIRW